MDKKKTGISRLMELAAERGGLLLGSALLSAGSALFMLLPYMAVYYILAELLKNAANPLGMEPATMLKWGGAALGGLTGGVLCMYVSGLMSHMAAYRILYSLRVRLAEHIGTLPLGYLNHTSTGAVKKTLEQNVEKLEGFLAHQLPDLVNVFVTALFTILVMLAVHPWLTLAAIAPLVLGFWLQMQKRSGKAAETSARKYYDALEKIQASTIQYVKGIPAVKVFGKTVYSFRKFYGDMLSYRDYCVGYTDHFQNTYIAAKILLNSTLFCIVPVGILLLGEGPVSLAFSQSLLFFIILAPGVASPMFRLMGFASSIADISEAVARIDTILEQRPIKEASSPKIPSAYDIEFEQVSFSYQEGEDLSRDVLSDVSFKAVEGSITALVGPSGSGKSTVANLIPRFWDVQRGTIRIGGVDVQQIATSDLMNLVAFVFQDTFLFYDTLYENIRAGKENASREEILAAAKAAQCHEFIERLENGYDTVIGRGGVHLSGGEEQRICVARAILKNAPILVLDEATAFADPENEYHMQLALRELMKEKTVIMIAHRLQTIQNAHQILVMNQGKIWDRGTHTSLLQSPRGLYKKLWDAYRAAADWKIQKGSAVG